MLHWYPLLSCLVCFVKSRDVPLIRLCYVINLHKHPVSILRGFFNQSFQKCPLSTLERVTEERPVKFSRDQICCLPWRGVHFRECPLRESWLYFNIEGLSRLPFAFLLSGYQGGAPPGYQQVPPPPPQTTTYVYQAPPVHVPMGNCPACQRGILRDEFTVAGLCCAILFFPIGILCCLAMTEKRCSSCGFLFYGWHSW